MEDKLGVLIDKLGDNGKTYIYYDEFLDMELEIKRFSLRKFSKMQEGADKSTDKALETMYKIIYDHVPLFQNNELFEKSGVQKRENVIAKIYDEKLKPIEKIFNFINTEVYQLDVDVEKKVIEEFENGFDKFKKDNYCNLISYYLNRGHTLSSILNLSENELTIYTYSMMLEIEKENIRNGG